MATFSRSVEAWRPLLEKHRGDLPIDFLLAWIRHESAGNPCSVGIPNVEAGIFQLFYPDDSRFGGSFSAMRAACVAGTQRAARELTAAERELQVRAGIAYVRNAREVARAQLAEAGAAELWPEPDFYALVKLRHALPAFGKSYLKAFRNDRGRPPLSWKEWRGYVEGLTPAQVVAINRAVRPWSSSAQRARLFNNAEKTAGVLGAFGGFVTPELLLLLALLAGLLFLR